MTWSPLDCHAHTVMSDGDLTVAEVVAVAKSRGVRPTVSDHLSRDVRGAVASVPGIRAYLDELDRHPVMRAGEFCWHDSLWRDLAADVAARFTHRIGSLHGIHLPDGRLAHAFSSRWPSGLTPAAYMDAHADNAERLTREMPVDILAHPTLVAIPLRAIPPEELWSEAHEERLVRALAAAGIAFELNTRYPPHERLVRRALASGVRLSLGSDGHTRAQVADVAFGLALARSLGVRDEDLYDPAVHGSRTEHVATRD